MKRLLTLTMVLMLLLSALPVGTGHAQGFTPAAGQAAGERMHAMGMIQGRPGPNGQLDLNLNGEITRAELVTVIVRAFGKEEDAKLLRGTATFADARNHWASGNIAMAVALVEKAGGDPIGLPDGTFHPDGKLTPAQAVAFLMKFLGLRGDPNKTWPASYLDVAVSKGIIDAGTRNTILPMINENATRGLVFFMYDQAFRNYLLPDGKTFYTLYVDGVPPVVTVNHSVTESAERRVTLSGTISDRSPRGLVVKIQGQPATVDATGNWSGTAILMNGENEIAIQGIDLAGNVGIPAQPVKITGLGIPPVLAFLRDDTVFLVGLEKPNDVTQLSPTGSAVRVGQWAQYSQPAVSADGRWVYFVRIQQQGGPQIKSIMRASLLPGGPAEVVLDLPEAKSLTDLAVAPGGGVMFNYDGELYRMVGKSLQQLKLGAGLRGYGAGTGAGWLLASLLGETQIMGFKVPQVRGIALCGTEVKVLSRTDERTVHWNPVALPDGSGFIYGDGLLDRLVVQKWDGTTRTLEVAGLPQARGDGNPAVSGDGMVAFESAVQEGVTSVVVIRNFEQPGIVTQVPGNSPSLGGVPLPRTSAGPCSGQAALNWIPAAVQASVLVNVD